MNGGIAIAGVLRDLNHHLTPYRTAAQITLADWQCGVNGCREPYADLQHSLSRRCAVPAECKTAGKYLKLLPQFSFASTDVSWLTEGKVSLRHIANAGGADGKKKHTLTSLAKKGFKLASSFPLDAGLSRLSRKPTELRVGAGLWLAAAAPLKHHVETLRWLDCFDLTTITNSPPDAFLPPFRRKKIAEHRLLQVCHDAVSSGADQFRGDLLWATDGSSFPGEEKKNGGSVVGPVTVRFSLPSSADSMQAEIAALITASFLASEAEATYNNSSLILSDHLNSVRMLSSDFASVGRGNPARSLYVWLLERKTQTRRMVVQHVKAHTDASDDASRLNAEADLEAKKAAQGDAHFAFPMATFNLPPYALRNADAWIEGNMLLRAEEELVKAQLSLVPPQTARELERLRAGGLKGNEWLYTKSSATYSVEIQLLLRSHALPTASRSSSRYDEEDVCPRCLEPAEDETHAFQSCLLIRPLLDEIRKRFKADTQAYLDRQEPPLPQELSQALLQYAEALPDATEWYRTLVPPLPPRADLAERTRATLEMMWHKIAIQAAGRIWGERMRAWYKKKQQESEGRGGGGEGGAR